uniref:Uncharacterized protein n=1 Tax=Utricularia reniformis TaxID=192314 RepID=A0A1Y0AZI6_9LAMI|nr:hypothetical protein AEK19_MT0301 [Utricularia reniformis]ART30577.1 hypothetical protein AEK19_MT0301 [Utricularia reniformis]
MIKCHTTAFIPQDRTGRIDVTKQHGIRSKGKAISSRVSTQGYRNASLCVFKAFSGMIDFPPAIVSLSR